MPDDWTPTDSHRERARGDGLDVQREAAKFRAHHEAKGSLMANWNAAFTTWLLNAKDFQPRTKRKEDDADAFIDREIERFRRIPPLAQRPEGLERIKVDVPKGAA